MRLANFQYTLGKAKGKQAFVEDQAKRDAAKKAKGKGETKPVTMGQASPGKGKGKVHKPVKVPPRFPNKVIGVVPPSQGASSSEGIAARPSSRPAPFDMDRGL